MPCRRSVRSNDIDIESSFFFFFSNTSSLSFVVLLSFLLIVSRCRVSGPVLDDTTLFSGNLLQQAEQSMMKESSDHKSDLQICSHLVNKRHSTVSAHHPCFSADLQDTKDQSRRDILLISRILSPLSMPGSRVCVAIAMRHHFWLVKNL
jgi:hypothetical protein